MSLAARSRHGLSVLEFVGCLSAMIGGVVLGSMYLGVDVRRMGMAVLKQAQLIEAGDDAEPTTEAEPAGAKAKSSAEEPVAAGATVAPPTTPTIHATDAPGAPHESTPTPEAAKAEPQPTATAPVATPPAPAANNPLAKLLNREDLISLTDDQRRTLTIAYWEALDACMKEESGNRLASIRSDGDFTLFDFLTCRKQGHQQAVQFISQLNLRGVDAHVAAYAEKALAWHKDGVTLFGRALDLLTDAPTAQFTGPFAQSWQSASTQHQMEERLLGEKHAAVQHYLDHKLLAEPTESSATPTP